MKKLVLTLATLTLALTALAGVKLKADYEGDLYNPLGAPTGGTFFTNGTDTLHADPDGPGGYTGADFYWDNACGCYTNPPDNDIRWIITCVGQTPDGQCICWSFEIWMLSDSPPYTWSKVDEGLMY